MTRYEISTYVAGNSLFIQRNEIGNRCFRMPIASCPHDRFCLAVGEAILRHLETGVPGRVVELVNGRTPTRRRLSASERRRIELELETLLASDQELTDFISQANDHTRGGLEDVLKRTRKQISTLQAELEAQAKPDTPVEPFTEVHVVNLFQRVADVMSAGANRDDLRELISLRIARIEPLRVCFETRLRVPTDVGQVVELGPIPFSVERTTRLPRGERSTAMAELCFDNAWPPTVVAPGIPFLCAGYSKGKVAGEISRILKPLIGGKAAGLVAWSEIPQLIGVVGRHLGLGKPEIDVPGDLEERILATYVNGEPKGPKAWPQFSDEYALVSRFRQVHSEGEASASGVKSELYWCREGWLRRDTHRFGPDFQVGGFPEDVPRVTAIAATHFVRVHHVVFDELELGFDRDLWVELYNQASEPSS